MITSPPTFLCATLRFVLLLALTQGVYAKEDPFKLVQAAVRQDKKLLERRAAYECTAISKREKLNSARQVTKTETQSTTLNAGQSPDYETRKAPEGVKGMEEDLRKSSQEEPFNILQIIDHFNYEHAGQETINGVVCHKIRFTPKGGQPFNNREEKVANEVAGYFWVSVKDQTLMKNKGSLTKPVSVAWFFATLKEMEFSFDTKKLPNGDFAPSRIQYRFRVQIPFGQIHEQHTRLMKDYRKTSKKIIKSD
ncbi:MAG: hypothetical protein SH807_10370 [Blastochloris sp.]|nr:hypothetical protein [Blastochloris sp.]